ncbi:MAG: MmcQ/YjbR family DNA-binding protein [Vicinamibacterales bacterium]
MTIAAAMKMGAVLPDVERTTSWGAPTLKVRGKMMACQAINKAAEPNTLVVCMPIADRDELIAADPETYYLKPHYEEYSCVLVRLSKIQPDALRGLLRMGWEFARSRAKRKPPARAAQRRHP